MTISANTVSLSNTLIDSKSILSRLLAGENIDVQHQNVHTASFDVQNRVLTLPMWDNMTNELYDMLVGHEVAHALFTPAGSEPLMDAVATINSRDFAAAKDCLNIVEDARIERLMKDKFPGLVRDFRIGYDRMHEDGIFGDLPASSIGMPLMDRVNLHFKLENRYAVSFNAEEQDLVNRIALATEWSEVVDLARELYDMSKLEQDEKNQEQEESESGQTPEKGQSGNGGSSSPSNESTDEDSEGEDGKGSGGDAGDDEDVNGTPEGSESGDGEDTGGSMEDDTDTGESADSDAVDGTAASGQEASDSGSSLQRSTTQQGMEDALVDKDRAEDEHPALYGSLPVRMDVDKVIVPVSEITKELSENLTIDQKIAIKAYADTFLRDQKLLINVMAKQFDMKKAADVARRAQISKTGVLDTVKMVNYKFSEDIFRRNTILPKGKNHGMVVQIDWSGSMDAQMGDTIQQAINLVMFCKRIGIPFAVYGFTTGWDRRNRYDADGEIGSITKGSKNFKVNGDGFRLLEMSSSDLSPTDYAQSLVNMVTLMDYFNINGGRRSKARVFTPNDYYCIGRRLGLGGTPLDEAIAATAPLIMRMRDAGVQHPTAVFLTDGCSGSGPISYYGAALNGSEGGYYRDAILKIGNKVVEGKNDTDRLLNWLRQSTGCRTIGYFLTDNGYYATQYINDHDKATKVLEDFDKNKYVALTDYPGYDHYFVFDPKINGRALNAFDNLPENASAARAKTAFIKQAAAKKAERSMLTTLAGNFAEV